MATEKLGIVIDATVKGARAVREFGDDLSDLERSAKSTGQVMRDDLSGAFTKFSNIMAGAALAGIAAGGVALFEFGKQSLQTASDVEEMSSKFDTVFKHLSDDVTAELGEFADAANRSVYDLQGFAATLQDTFVPLGFARGEAAQMSVQLVKLAEDLGSFNNLRTEDVVRDLQSALVGNTETLRKYGVVASQAAIEQEAYSSGLWSGEEALSANIKAQAILNLTMKSTTDAQGDAIKTADSYENVSKGLAAATTDLQVVIGDKLIPALTDAKVEATNYVNTLKEAIEAESQMSDLQKRGLTERQKFGLELGKIGVTLAALTGDQETINKAVEIATAVQEEYNATIIAAERPIRGNAEAVQELTDKLRAQQEHQDMVNSITQDTDRIIAQYGLGINSTSRELEEMAYASGELEGAEDRLNENIAATNERMEAQDEQAKALREAHELAAKAAAEHAAMQGDLFAEALRNSGEETESLAMQLYGAADAAGAGAEELAFLALATGEFTEEQVQAALEAAIMKEQIQLLAEQVADGSITVEQATEALGLMQDGMAGSVTEAQTLIGEMENMSVAMSELDGKTVNLNFSAPGLSGIVQQMSALQGGAGGVIKTTNVNGNTQVAGALATGGPVSAGNAYLVGEQGPEVVVMGGNGTVIPNHELGGHTINITVNGGGGNGRRIGQQVAAEVNNALGRLN